MAIIVSVTMTAQKTGYYNGTDGKVGDELKEALHNIIKGHTPYSYHSSKYIFQLSDADPDNPNNVIQVYTGFSHDNSDYGSSGLQLNREHVWAKSHGGFTDWLPMYSDVHNLKPSAASVNISKSNLDFDNGGVQHSIATGCYYTDTTWEARDEVKGDIARIIFYMATRYEGGDGEIDLEVVDNDHSYPNAQHGKLSTLLEWNEQDPPDDFERNRNNVIESYQHNRNPFIDNPEWINMIWGYLAPGPVTIDNVAISPEIAVANEPIIVSATMTINGSPASAGEILWGLSYDDLTNTVAMSASGDVFTGQIPGQAEDATIYYKVVGYDDTESNSTVTYNFYVPKIFSGELISIYDIQGQQDDSPYDGQVVSTSGVVTGNFGSSYFIQDGSGLWNGLFIYESGRNPQIGDSVIITGKITEYYNKTEMTNITDYYFISSGNELPEPIEVATGEVEEGHESVLVRVTGATCTDANYQANYYMWTVDDGSGELRIHNTSIFEFEPTDGAKYNITGPMNYDFDEWKIELRYASDVEESHDEDPPYVIEVNAAINTNLTVLFNEDVEKASAEKIDNYSLDNGIEIISASQHQFIKAQVNLTISALENNSYILTIKDIADVNGNVMTEPQEFGFTYLGIGEIVDGGDISIYPNPTNNNLNIDFNAKIASDMKVVITDMSGRQVIFIPYKTNVGANSIHLDVSDLSKGVYFLSVSDGEDSYNKKIIIK